MISRFQFGWGAFYKRTLFRAWGVRTVYVPDVRE